MCNFHVGQKVVYVGPDRSFDPNPGKTIHVIEAIRKGCCKDNEVEIDVGERLVNGISWCEYCKSEEDTAIYWKSASVFRPLISEYTEEEIEAVNIDEVIEPFLEPIER